MAINDIVQTVADARVDARSLSDFVFKPAGFKVTRRLAPPIDTLQFYINRFNSLNGDFSSSVSVALSSLSNSVAEAEGKVAYIESTVQDAINNTAIEGGVLADTFVVVDGSLSQRTINKGLESIADLSTINNPKDGLRVYVKSYHAGKHKGGGDFVYDSSRILENDGGNVINGWVRLEPENYLSAHNFGAIGDGDDSHFHDDDAFERISAIFKRDVLGFSNYSICLEAGHYRVGRHKPIEDDSELFAIADTILDIFPKNYLDISVTINSESAKFTVRDGLFFGTFNKNTLEPYYPQKFPFYSTAHPEFVLVRDFIRVYRHPIIIEFRNIEKAYLIGSLSVDMNSSNAVIGGGWGDKGHQVPAYGLKVRDVKVYDINNLDVKNSCLDGVAISSLSPTSADDLELFPDYSGVLRNVHSSNNGRQGISITGGINISFYDCSFYDIGGDELPVTSAPSSCCDLEAEGGKYLMNLAFKNCKFSNGAYSALVVDGGKTSNVSFEDCVFSAPSTVAWLNKPKLKFNRCVFYGLVTQLYKTKNKDEAPLFENCIFSNDPRYTTTSTIFSFTGGNGVIRNSTVLALTPPIITHVSGALLEYDNVTVVLDYDAAVLTNKPLLNFNRQRGFLKFRDIRTENASKTRINTELAGFDGVVVRQTLDEDFPSFQIFAYGAGNNAHSKVVEDTVDKPLVSYLPLSDTTLPKLVGVEKSTGETEADIALNKLIDSLVASGRVLQPVP